MYPLHTITATNLSINFFFFWVSLRCVRLTSARFLFICFSHTSIFLRYLILSVFDVDSDFEDDELCTRVSVFLATMMASALRSVWWIPPDVRIVHVMQSNRQNTPSFIPAVRMFSQSIIIKFTRIAVGTASPAFERLMMSSREFRANAHVFSRMIDEPDLFHEMSLSHTLSRFARVSGNIWRDLLTHSNPFQRTQVDEDDFIWAHSF